MMAREAKVGLLLGLVFIVAIAIVLRGVHETSQPNITEQLALKESEPVLNDLAVVVEKLNTKMNQSKPKPVTLPQTPPSIHQQQFKPATQMTSPNVTYNNKPIRYEQSLPQKPTALTGEPTLTEKITKVVPPVKLPESVEEAIDKVEDVEPVTTVVKPVKKKKKQKKMIYVVKEGDDLSRIAKKIYGKEEGNRWVNVEKIFAANRKTMSTIDEIRVGQRLMIPMLEKSQTPTTSSESTKTSKPKQKTTSSRSGKTYVVKDGDSLWKIAAKQLGNGARYAEITKLNKNLLEDENDLKVGMKIRLPKK